MTVNLPSEFLSNYASIHSLHADRSSGHLPDSSWVFEGKIGTYNSSLITESSPGKNPTPYEQNSINGKHIIKTKIPDSRTEALESLETTLKQLVYSYKHQLADWQQFNMKHSI